MDEQHRASGLDSGKELWRDAHVGLLRYGAPGAANPEGWQLDIEGAAFPRLTLDVSGRTGVNRVAP